MFPLIYLVIFVIQVHNRLYAISKSESNENRKFARFFLEYINKL
jgi:hypothetical protein